MKKIIVALFAVALLLTGCSSSASKEIETLRVAFVPSQPADEILAAAEPLEAMIIEEMGKLGYTIGNVDITVGTSYEAVGEALTAGTVDVGLIPGGTYVLYADDGVELALTATRFGLSEDSENPQDWNDAPTENTTDQVTYYRSLIVAGPSEKGQELSDKVANGEELTYDDLASATWCVQSPSSSAGYLYPSLWLTNNYGKTISDLPTKTEMTGYGDSISRLSAEQCDVAPMFADARMVNEDAWTREESIWDGTNVIGVTDGIMNDTISVSQNSPVYSEDFVSAIQTTFMEIASTEEGLATVAPYSHQGYQIGKDSDYDAERQVQEEVISAL